MLLVDIEEIQFAKEYPALLQGLKDYESQLPKGVEIVVSANSPSPTFCFRCEGVGAQYDDLNSFVGSFCWKCGIKHDVILNSQPWSYEYLCPECLFENVDESTYLSLLLNYIDKNPENASERVRNIMIRCFTKNNESISCTLADLYRTDKGFCVKKAGWLTHKKVPVRSLSLSTGRRDKNGKLIYSNDIVTGRIDATVYPDLEYLNRINDEALKAMSVVRTRLPNNSNKFVWALAPYDGFFPVPLDCIKDPIVIGSNTN